jgi:spermidine synthase
VLSQNSSSRGLRNGYVAYCAAVLAGAALLFQIQPIVGKLLLPSFGGGAWVWTTCMFFFQFMLLAGYSYAHLLTKLLQPRSQVVAHLSLLALSLFSLPVGLAGGDFDATDRNPGASILLTLLVTIGFSFLMLASTAPLIQRWSSLTGPARSPYSLYALSNAGALLALLSYPFLVEPNMSLKLQSLAWSAGYGGFVVLQLAASRLVWKGPERWADQCGPAQPAVEGRTCAGRRVADSLFTVVLSACGVVILLSVTSEITQNVAPIPFLWVLPLVVYLLTYIICFSGGRWYDRAVWGSFFVVAACTLVILHFFATSFPIVPVVTTYVLVLFCTCVVCHAELYRLRPAPRRLTGWYLLIAFGGTIGGAFVSIAAPLMFVRYWEALVGAYLIYLALGPVVLRDAYERKVSGALHRLSAAQARVEQWGVRLFAAGWVIGMFLFPAVVVSLNTLRVEYDIASIRNFYGVLNIRDMVDDGVARRVLVDGTTIHGFQLLEETGRKLPTSYYGANTGIAAVMENIVRPSTGLNVGVVGLGTGTLAAYGKPADQFRFYEINPAVVDVANEHFSFLADSAAELEIVLGDGRISLERELRQSGSRRYDVLVIDAFNSDAIPVHLLTLEALELYWSHLKSQGVLALHLTNNYLDLVPVAASLGSTLGKEVLYVTTPRDIGVTSTTDWVLIAADSGPFADGATEESQASDLSLPAPERIWTDDYSDLLGALKANK